MEEKVYYENHGIKITNRRVIHGKDQKTTAISQINSVATATGSVVTQHETKMLFIFLGLCLGGILAFIIVYTGFVGKDSFTICFLSSVMAGGLIGSGFGKSLEMENIYYFRITTSSGDSDAFEHMEKPIIDEMVEALNQAIIENLNTKEQAQQPQPKQESSGSGDKISKLKSLGEMLQAGLLTQEEFDKEKKKLLDD